MLVIGLSAASSSFGSDLEGFLEPIRTIQVASEDSGTIADVYVKEGSYVEANTPLARLNCDVLESLLAIADQNMKSVGRLEAAKADLTLRRDRLEKLEPLRRQGHARQEEIDRANYECQLAEANLLAAQEELAGKRLEFQKIQTQIENRTVRSPIAGFITILHKDLGEFVAPNSPEVLTLVQVDQLLANFTLLGPQSKRIQLGDQIKVLIDGQEQVAGVVDFISPITNAESGTTLARILIENPDQRFRSGQRCRITIND